MTNMSKYSQFYLIQYINDMINDINRDIFGELILRYP